MVVAVAISGLYGRARLLVGFSPRALFAGMKVGNSDSQPPGTIYNCHVFHIVLLLSAMSNMLCEDARLRRACRKIRKESHRIKKPRLFSRLALVARRVGMPSGLLVHCAQQEKCTPFLFRMRGTRA